MNFGQKGTVFVHAYTGQILGTGSARTRAFFRSVMEWHRWIALKDARRATGKAITGVSNLVFLFIVLSGFYLWWPRDVDVDAVPAGALVPRWAPVQGPRLQLAPRHRLLESRAAGRHRLVGGRSSATRGRAT